MMVERKKKLLVFASTFPRWKNDTNPPFVYELSKRLTNDFDVSVLTPNYPGAKKDEVMDKMKVHRFRYFFKKGETLAGSGGILPTLKKSKWNYFKIPFFMFGEFLALRKQIKENRPDIIHAHWIIPQGFIAALCKKLYGVEYVVTTWGGDMFIFKNNNFYLRFLKKIYRITLDNSLKSTTVNSVFEKEMKMISKNKEKILYIPNGADTNLFNPSKKNNLIRKKYNIEGYFLLFVGRLAEKKGIGYLLDAMPKVLDDKPKTKLMIIGTGLLEKELKQQVKELKIESNIIFTGAIQNNLLPEYYATADIFIGPSITTKGGDREGFPTVFVEAMSSGTPILTTKIDGIKEIIKIGKNGFIVNQKSSRELSKKILEIMQNKDKLNLMKSNSRKIAKKEYDWGVLSKKYKEILK